MFANAALFDQELGSWDVSKAEDMHGMFSGSSPFNHDLNNWNTSNCRRMSLMFDQNRFFNQDISGWDVSNVQGCPPVFGSNHDAKGFFGMFRDATSFNRDISKWDTSKTDSTKEMFKGATHFGQDLHCWDLSKTTTMANMFSGATNSCCTANENSKKIECQRCMLSRLCPAVVINGPPPPTDDAVLRLVDESGSVIVMEDKTLDMSTWRVESRNGGDEEWKPACDAVFGRAAEALFCEAAGHSAMSCDDGVIPIANVHCSGEDGPAECLFKNGTKIDFAKCAVSCSSMPESNSPCSPAPVRGNSAKFQPMDGFELQAAADAWPTNVNTVGQIDDWDTSRAPCDFRVIGRGTSHIMLTEKLKRDRARRRMSVATARGQAADEHNHRIRIRLPEQCF
jgi:surface protein